VYGPKALACIAGLPPTLASRCIPVTMFRAAPGSVRAARALGPDAGEWQSLRDDLHALALEWGREWLDPADRAGVGPEGIANRDRELWQPLLALAALVQECGVKGLLPLVQRHAKGVIDANRDDAVPEADEVLLEVFVELVKRGACPTAGEVLAGAKQRDQS